MKPIAKYNVCKGVSTVLTVGTPIITLASCSELFVHRSDTAISAAGIFALLLMTLLLKDKIAENFKIPSAFVLSTSVLILICLMEKIIIPTKYVCITTMIASGVDELTFKRFYKLLELRFPEQLKSYKHFGFVFGTSNKLLGGDDES